MSLPRYPSLLRKFKTIVELNLSVNKIETIPDEIGNLTTLQKLYLSFNKIKYV